MVKNLFESLESRVLLSTPKSYNLLSLSGFDDLGVKRTYSSGYQISGTLGNYSGSGNQNISIERNKKKINGNLCCIVDSAESNGSKSNIAWYEDKKGANIGQSIFSIGDLLKITLNYTDTRIAPKNMVVGKSYKDTGEMNGKLAVSMYDETINMTISGGSKGTSTLFGLERISVGGGQYNAVKGQYALSFSGKAKVKVEKKNFTFSFSGAEQETFWADPKIGIIEINSHLEEKVSAKGIGSENVVLDSWGELSSSSAAQKSAAMPLANKLGLPKNESLFGDSPILD